MVLGTLHEGQWIPTQEMAGPSYTHALNQSANPTCVPASAFLPNHPGSAGHAGAFWRPQMGGGLARAGAAGGVQHQQILEGTTLLPQHLLPALAAQNQHQQGGGRSSSSGNSAEGLHTAQQEVGGSPKQAHPFPPPMVQVHNDPPKSSPQCGMANKQQQNSNKCQKKAGAASSRARQADTSSDDEHGGHGKKNLPHSTVEKARRDRLNNLIEALADLVPASERKYAADSGIRRPKHVILSDTHTLLRALKSKPNAPLPAATAAAEGAKVSKRTSAGRSNSGRASPAHFSPQPPQPTADPQQEQPPPTSPLPQLAGPLVVLPGPAAATQREPSTSDQSTGLRVVQGPLDMSLPFGMASTCTGVLIELKQDGSTQGVVWRVTVTCRDRNGLLLDLVSAMTKLPLCVQAASLRVCHESNKTQCAFEVLILDPLLTPDEVQCVVNAAVYAHLTAANGAQLAQPVQA